MKDDEKTGWARAWEAVGDFVAEKVEDEDWFGLLWPVVFMLVIVFGLIFPLARL